MAQRLCVATLQEVEAVVAQFEVDHTVQFGSYSGTKNFAKLTLEDLKKNKICIRLKDPQPLRTTLVIHTEDDDPFAILGKKALACIYGRDFSIKKKTRNNERRALLGLAQRRVKDSRRKDCPAKILIRHIVSFPGFKESKTTSKDVFVRNLRKRLQNKENVPHEYRYYIYLPGEDEHANHPTGEDAGTRHSMAAPLRSRIDELAGLGVHSPAAIKIHLRFLVENELFKGKTPPPKTNRMYWPNRETIYSCVYRYNKGIRRTRLKNFNRNYDVVPHNLIPPVNGDLLHQAVDEVALDETAPRTVQNVSVSPPKKPKTKTTSTSRKRHSNPSLQHNEGTILSGLLPIGGIPQNSLPIISYQNNLPTIQVINPSHYLGEGQLYLNSQGMQQEITHLNTNSTNMTKKVQRKRKGSPLDGDAQQQQGHFFQLRQAQQNPNGAEEGQASLVFVPSEAMHEWTDSLQIEPTFTTSLEICQPSIETSLEAPAASPDECVLVEVQESQCVSEVETIYQQLSSTDCFPLMDDTHIEEVSVLTSSPEEVSVLTSSPEEVSVLTSSPEEVSVLTSSPEEVSVLTSSPEEVSVLTSSQEEISVVTSSQAEVESQEPTVCINHSSLQWSPSFCELDPGLSNTDSLHHIVHDHDYGGSLGNESLTIKTVDVSKKVTVQRQDPIVKPNLELPTSSVEHLKDLLDTRDIPSIAAAFINMPSLKSELVKQLVKLY